MMQRAVADGLESCLGVGRALRGHLKAFRDVILTDSTVVRLHDLLADVYPACRTNHTGSGDRNLGEAAGRGNARHERPSALLGQCGYPQILLRRRIFLSLRA